MRLRGILCQETTLVDRIAERRLNWAMGMYQCYTAMGKEGKEDNQRNGWTM